MKNKVMVIGLGPEYNYNPKDHNIWKQNNTKYASNHGASLISRTLINFFDADYIADLENPERYKEQYNLCVIAFATHITTWRNVSDYTQFVKKLGIKTVAFSLGIQDYYSSTLQLHTIHPSMKELLDYVLTTSDFIGVRGPHTASLLLKSGFKSRNIIRIGCPTMFGNLSRDVHIEKKANFSNPIIVFHRTMGELNKNILSNATLLGQDFLDEAVFTDNLLDDNPIVKDEINNFKKLNNGQLALIKIKENGMFPKTFDEWYNEIGKHDFVLGARLHGCIAALIQGIPAVMIARDIRVMEIAEFFKIPYLKYDEVGEMSVEDIYNFADFTEFNKLYKHRFDNFIKLMNDLDILKDFNTDVSLKVPDSYYFSQDDLSANDDIIYDEIAKIQKSISELTDTFNYYVKRPIDKIKRIPGAKAIKKLF